MKKYVALKDNGQRENYLKVETYYSLGGMNYFTYKQERRGYYISVCPVERWKTDTGFMMEGYTAFTGIKRLLKEVTRKSAKAEQEADKMAKDYENILIVEVCSANGLQLAE